MDIRSIFDHKAGRIFWRPIPSDHVTGGSPPQPCEANACYFALRVTEMYLESCRKLWKQVYPVVHAYVDVGGAAHHVIIGPTQLAALGDANLNLLADFNQRLVGPVPYLGGDVHLLAGLYSIPGRDAAKVLVDTTAAMAGLAVQTASKVTPLAAVVKNAVEALVGIDKATLHLGIQCDFGSTPCPLATGYWVGIAASDGEVDIRQLWLKDGRLCKGNNAGSAGSYNDHDFMVIAIERIERRADWHIIPAVTEFAARFAKIVGDPDYSLDDKRRRLAALWPVFQQALADSPDFIDADRRTVSQAVSADLLQRLDAHGAANPFQEPSRTQRLGAANAPAL